jgi:phospholipase/carboxylesterase
MNRIDTDPSEIAATGLSTGIKKSSQWLTRARRDAARYAAPQTDLAFATFAPIHYEERYAYPLLIWLHGDAGSEQELRQIMPHVSMRNYVAIAPRGSWQDPRNRSRFDWKQTPESIESAESRIADCISVAQKRYNVHTKRIFLVGREAGGTMALRVAWNNPSRFAGVGAFHGPLPSQLSPLRRVNELRQLPCLLTTSKESVLYPEKLVCNDLRLLHTAGCKVTLRHYPGDDGLTDNMLSDLDSWLMELVCGANRDS